MNASLFSSKGRIGRGDYALILFALLVAQVLVRLLLIKPYLPPDVPLSNYYAIIKVLPPKIATFFAVFSLIAFKIGISAQIKRVHDFGWSGWTITGPILGMVGVGFISGLFGGLGNAAIAGLIMGLGVFVVALYYIALTGMLLFRKGNEGANAFGGGDATPGGARVSGLNRVEGFKEVALAGASYAPPRNGVNDILLTSYKSPQDRRAGFGRRGAA